MSLSRWLFTRNYNLKGFNSFIILFNYILCPAIIKSVVVLRWLEMLITIFVGNYLGWDAWVLLSKDKKSTCFLLIGGESIEVERYNTYICECVKSQTYNIDLNITLHLLFSFELNQSFKSAYSKLLINIKFISIKTTNKNCLIDWVLS